MDVYSNNVQIVSIFRTHSFITQFHTRRFVLLVKPFDRHRRHQLYSEYRMNVFRSFILLVSLYLRSHLVLWSFCLCCSYTLSSRLLYLTCYRSSFMNILHATLMTLRRKCLQKPYTVINMTGSSDV